jgi:hypothetical protein
MTICSWVGRSAAMAAALLLLTACGSDSSDDATPGGDSTKDCGAASAAVVNGALGTSVGDPVQSGEGTVIVCTYTDTKSNLPVTVRFQKESSSKTFKTGRDAMDASGQTTTDLADAGDEAYSSSFKAGGIVPELNTVVVRKGSTEVLITAVAPIEKERDLANTLLD